MTEKEKVFTEAYGCYSNDPDADLPLPIGLSDYEEFAYDFFKLGREYGINSIWHDYREEPSLDKNVFVWTIDHSISMEFTDHDFFKYKWKNVEEWCYVKDIMKKG